ncbi:MAG: hypothetical protein AB1Z98_14995 [Nannocystaceae bacterium]
MPEATILPKTPARLRWTGSDWEYLDDAGNYESLPSSHELIVDYPKVAKPNPPIPLEVENTTSSSITLQATSTDGWVVPNGKVTIQPTSSQTWDCHIKSHANCGNQQWCTSWSLTNPLSDTTLPDPTFKVRWQASDGS